jgi:nitrogen-specific signal transduction histidine kinase
MLVFRRWVIEHNGRNSESMFAATQAVLIETPQYLEANTAALPVEETLQVLVHELRQPLSSIEAIAYYLEMTLPAEQVQARQYMQRLQELVDQASSVLDSAIPRRRKPCGRAIV